MITAISLCNTDYVDKSGAIAGVVVYTSKIATFEYGTTAMDFAENKDHILLIDCDSGKVLKDANITLED
jgi:hypothetical protein